MDSPLTFLLAASAAWLAIGLALTLRRGTRDLGWQLLGALMIASCGFAVFMVLLYAGSAL